MDPTFRHHAVRSTLSYYVVYHRCPFNIVLYFIYFAIFCIGKPSGDVLVMQTGGPFYEVELGRRDGRISTKASVRHKLPHPEFGINQLKSMFASHGLSLIDLVALSGTIMF